MPENSSKTDLKRLTKPAIQEFCRDLEVPRYRADQIFQWMYQKGVHDFAEMSNIPRELRDTLQAHAVCNSLSVASEHISADGTTKFLFNLHDNRQVEAVLIPEFFDDGVADRLTVCVSSQVGCVFGCSFCATGKMGFFRNLSPGEIADQAVYINNRTRSLYGKRITNIVYMGMGEPLHNYEAVMQSAAILCDPMSVGLSPRRITVSTVGLARHIRQMADEDQPWRLAVSLHAPNDAKRNRIMPVNESLNLGALKEALLYYHKKTKRDVTYEYLLFQEFNDSEQDARELAAIARWIPCKVNIIMYNNVLGVALQRVTEQRLNAFLKNLTRLRVRATVRRSRGDDIDAGCGQLAIREGQPRGKTIAR